MADETTMQIEGANHLRLVGTGPTGAETSARDHQLVAREVRRAAHQPELDPMDPRWVLAVRTMSQMEGSLLTPEKRERVMRTAKTLGVRPFEANVIIALVQEQRQRQKSPEALSRALAMLPSGGNAKRVVIDAEGRERGRKLAMPGVWWWSFAVALSALIVVLMVRGFAG